MTPYNSYQLLFGDIHNHCGISYGHGSLVDALANAQERLDFVSITGHAHWPDMPDATGRLKPVVDFHRKGFEKLKRQWSEMLRTLREVNQEGHFVVFPGFEIHFCADGDRNILYRDLDGEILYPRNLDDLNRQLRDLRCRGVETIAQPHHVAYRAGTRGINWDTFDSEFAPLVELVSMHGCSEEDDSTRPFLHVMGPSDGRSTIQFGLSQGHIFGVTGGTDHHSAHPGSYGHGMTGLWATDCTREAIWEAFYCRRSYALTGDRIGLQFTVNNAPMGSVIESSPSRRIEIEVHGGAAIDCVDIIAGCRTGTPVRHRTRDGQGGSSCESNLYSSTGPGLSLPRLLKRFSQCDFDPVSEGGDSIRTKLFLELGWGPRNQETQWDVEFGVRHGRVLDVEPRFRGRQVVSPLDSDASQAGYHTARVNQATDTSVTFSALGQGNPNNSTPNTQGMCLEVEMPVASTVYATINGQTWEWPVRDLIRGAQSGLMDGIESPAIRIHRAPLPHELHWQCCYEDQSDADYYYVRVRQKNDQWAWSSPVFVRR